jgi:hypothetical protein
MGRLVGPLFRLVVPVLTIAGCAGILGIEDLPPLPTGYGTDGGMDGATAPDDRDGSVALADGSDGASETDAAQPAPECSAIGETRVRPCGVCGTETSTCTAASDGGLGWGAYGACGGELAGGCNPGDVVAQGVPCGNCGTLTQTCGPDCRPADGACMGQPANSCVPNSDDKTTAGCPAPGMYRHRTCSQQCTWSSYGVTCI